MLNVLIPQYLWAKAKLFMKDALEKLNEKGTEAIEDWFFYKRISIKQKKFV